VGAFELSSTARASLLSSASSGSTSRRSFSRKSSLQRGSSKSSATFPTGCTHARSGTAPFVDELGEQLDAGESEVIALCIEIADIVAVPNEKKPRPAPTRRCLWSSEPSASLSRIVPEGRPQIDREFFAQSVRQGWGLLVREPDETGGVWRLYVPADGRGAPSGQFHWLSSSATRPRSNTCIRFDTSTFFRLWQLVYSFPCGGRRTGGRHAARPG
jgi:hypothetical protein